MVQIDLEKFLQAVRDHVDAEAEGNLYAWCQMGTPALNQSTVHKILNYERGVGLKMFLRLCARMKESPTLFYKAPTLDALKERLALLNEMVIDPAFPFEREDFFLNLAIQIENFYAQYLEFKDKGI